jgi:hypothetical protein
MMFVPITSKNSASGKAVWSVRAGRRHGPSITYKITPCLVTLLYPARRAAVLGQPSSLQPQWSSLLQSPLLTDFTVPHWPLPAVRDLTCDGRLSTYDERVLKLSKVSFRGKCTRTGHPVKLPASEIPAWLGHFGII